MTDYITYAHKDDPKGARFRDIKGGGIPSWAVDVQDEPKPKIKKRMNHNSATWEREANALARSFVDIYPCKNCGHPVVNGYCCGSCDSSNP